MTMANIYENFARRLNFSRIGIIIPRQREIGFKPVHT